MAVERTTRLNALLQRELGQLIEQICRNEGVSALVTVTGVEIASNLRNANVFVSVYGKSVRSEAVMELLRRYRVVLQRQLAGRVIMKYTPVLNFKLDTTAERADRVMAIINELDEEEAAKTPPQTDDAQ